MKGNIICLAIGAFLLSFIFGIILIPFASGNGIQNFSSDVLIFSAEKDGNSDIYIMDIEGFEAVPIAKSSANEHYPVLSPDGKHILYTSDETGTGEVYIMNVDGSDKRRLTEGGGDHPTWDPSGEWIYFCKPIGLRPFSYRWAIYKMDMNGKKLTRVTYFGYRNINPRISPNGTYIYFSDDPNWTPDNRIVRVNIDGTNPVIIFDKDGSSDVAFSISPDGTKLLMTASEHPSGYMEPNNLYFLDIKSGEKIRIFNRTGRECYGRASWSPDGTRFVYSYTPDYLYEKYDLYIYDMNSKNIIRITNTLDIDEREPSWGCWGSSSLVACWNFDEGKGNVVHDISGNNNDGIIHGASWTKGVWGYALSFDGEDDYVKILDSPSLDLTDSFTIEGWIYPRELEKNDHQFILCKHKTFYDDKGTWNLISPPNGNHLSFASSGQGSIRSRNISDFTWTHFAFTFNDTTDKYGVYINGKVDNTGNISFNIRNTSLNLYIGGEKYEEMWHFFNGLLDEIRIYNKDLSSEEIWQHYQKYEPPLSNLTIGNISFSNDEPIEGEVIHVTAMLVNKGNKHVTADMKFYDGEPDIGQLIGTAFNISIEPHGHAFPSIRWDTKGVHGEHKLWVKISSISPKDYSLEYETFRSILISNASEEPELYLSQEDISFSTQNPQVGEDVTIYAVIHNLGNTSAKAFVDFYDGKNLTNLIGTTKVFVDAKKTAVTSITWNAINKGKHVITVKVRDCFPSEKTEENNKNFNVLQVGGNYKPSLVITLGLSNIAPFEENTERTIPINIFCYQQAVENIHLVILEDNGLEVTVVTPDFTLYPGQKKEYLINIEVPSLENNKKIESKTVLIQAVGDAGAVWSNTEQIDILIHEPGLYFIFNIALILTGIGSILAFLFVVLTETGKYKFFSMLSLLIPSFVRVKKDKILDTSAREEIFEYITKNPGCHYSEIMHALGMKNGVLSYHLYVLEKEGLIFSHREGLKYRLFYPIGTESRNIVSRMTKLQKSILGAIKKNPGITQKELVKIFGKRQQTISYNIKILKRMGKIRRVKEGRIRRYYSDEDGRE